MSKLLPGLGRTMLALAVFVIVPTAGVLVPFQFMGPWFVAHEYARAGFPPAERYQPAERLALAQETVWQLISPNGEQGLAAMQHDGQPVYNAREVGHLVDVMRVLGAMRWMLAASGAIWLAALGVALFRPAWRLPLARSTFWGSAALLAVLGSLLVISLLSFGSFFVSFHELLFKADTWTFAYTDSLIQFYPVEFWMDFFWLLGASMVAEALLVAGLSLAYLRRRGVAR